MTANTNETALAPVAGVAPEALNLFSLNMFKDAWRVAEQLAKSKLIPQNFQNNPPDCIIAMEMAQRIGASIFSVMQSLYIVHGRPGWSAQFIIAALNSCGRFSPLRFDMTGEGDQKTCTAWALEKGTGEKLVGPPVSIEIAKKEGWYGKNGSKWQTMPELMLRYRSATFFGRLYAPDILMGMRTAEELHDTDEIIDVTTESETLDNLNKRFTAAEKVNTTTGEVVEPSDDVPVKEQEVSQSDPPPSDDEPMKISETVKKFMREVNKASELGSVGVDQWRAKHHNRVARECGGVESTDYGNIMQYANDIYQELVKQEKEAQQ